ncbi:MAG TPA: phosphoglucosamine mutase [Terriglobales bacterium]|nr:phosphoglucosamine mutase [Terriglobales bacterium]
MRKLFGTDGIRGVAGEFPLDADTSFIIGRALGHHLGRTNGPPKVVLGQDTRESSAWIADAVTAGLAAAGVRTESAGVITTPGIAYLARARGFAAGVVISASHNPWTDNGIKVFASSGYKLPDAVELEVEREIFSLLADPKAASVAERPAPHEPSLPGSASLQRLYVRWLDDHPMGTDLSHLRVVVDCANGAASTLAKEVFGACGVRCRYLQDAPDGRNINDHCGALFPHVVAEEVKRNEADLGVTFDGDADRALFADAAGNIVNGDAVLLLTARDLKTKGALRGDLVVATTMSNMGLEAALARSSIRMLRAPVGDKYVLEEMQKSGAVLGGEQSGHIIFADDHTTGDGLLTALRVMEIMARTGKPLAELVGDLEVFPQIIKNVRVREKKPLEQVPAVARAIAEAERALDGQGRVVVRYSGTEPLARVMVEAKSEQEMQQATESICAAIEKALGA